MTISAIRSAKSWASFAHQMRIAILESGVLAPMKPTIAAHYLRRGWQKFRKQNRSLLSFRNTSALASARRKERLKLPLGPSDVDALISDRLEKLVTRYFGLPFRCAGRERISGTHKRHELYATYELLQNVRWPKRNSPPRCVVLVKRGPRVARRELEEFLNGLQSPHFDTPVFFGCFRLESSVQIAAWDYVRGRHPNLERTSPDDIAQVVRAVAAMNAVPDEAVRHIKDLKMETPGVGPVAAQLEHVARRLGSQCADSNDLLRQIEAFALAEPRLLNRLETLGNRFFTHHDIKAENLIVRETDGRLVIIDWNTTRLSAPGVGLRQIYHNDPSLMAETISYYVECMRQLGHELALADVEFAAKAHLSFRALSNSITSQSVNRLRRGLDFVQKFHLLDG
jgi:hypothetical protein